MNGPQFFQTPMGKQFYDGTMPQIAKHLKVISEALNEETINGLIGAINRLAAAQEDANKIARASLSENE